MIRNITILLLLSLSFGGTVADIDENVYETVQIGDQIWMAENLRTTHYKNGDEITLYDPDNNPSNSEIYGKLYNWSNATDSRGICMEGWHLSSDEEWIVLEEYIGMCSGTSPGCSLDFGMRLFLQCQSITFVILPPNTKRR